MTTAQITPELVQEMYSQLDNKHLFLVVFGTKKFHNVSADFLAEMYNYLISKKKWLT